MVDTAGSAAPVATAIAMFTGPANKPFRHAITIASFADTLRVRLLSIAQHRHAPTISSAPTGTPAAAGFHDSSTPPATIATMPRNTCRSTFSRNTTHAITAVSTPSRFSSSALVAAGVLASPSISSAGPATPPAAIAPASHGISDFVSV